MDLGLSCSFAFGYRVPDCSLLAVFGLHSKTMNCYGLNSNFGFHLKGAAGQSGFVAKDTSLCLSCGDIHGMSARTA